MNAGGSAIEGNEFVGKGLAAIFPAFLISYIGNGMAEELLFRGFICKRFVKKINIKWGIIISSLFFGLMHVVLILLAGIPVGGEFYIYEFVYTGLAAAMLGFCNEKIFMGSIWPSILIHGTVDFISNIRYIWS